MSAPSPAPRRPRALVTGCAGFLGSRLAEELLGRGWSVLGVDSFTDYYARPLKERNVTGLRDAPGFELRELDLAQHDLTGLLDGIDVVFHLAAQPGVRASFGMGLEMYLSRNVRATQRLLDQAARADLTAFVYASSSSVYGNQPRYPVSEDATPAPASPYGATKVITEQLAGAFWRAHGVPVIGLRYFTVYGPRQRPDMAFARFVQCALEGRPLAVLGDGRQVREFTYVDDVVSATMAAADRGERGAVYNIGGGEPVSVMDAIALLEELVERPLLLDFQPSGRGDPRRTHADVRRARRDLRFEPRTSLRDGLARQVLAEQWRSEAA
ncbi:MAG TPA: NAD-dependent epimerase/dehydratase family protein [Thermoleophilaceae bacterium]|nr:NAD-dependent epimerase/dehydratase family protein [Thermoleophilaceae bacterium]